MTTPLQQDWDWVTARSQCSGRTFFERLRLNAQANIDKRMELYPPSSADTTFKLTGKDNQFAVFAEHKNSDVIRFRWDGERIAIAADRGQVNFEGTVTVSDDGLCRLRVGTEELDEWQILKRALEGLLFGS